MAIVIISHELEKEINKIFKKESVKVFDLLYSLEKNPKKGKPIGHIGKILIKELKYKKFRFYFITSGHVLKVMNINELESLIIKFVRMSDKKNQQRVINEIKEFLRKLGESFFS